MEAVQAVASRPEIVAQAVREWQEARRERDGGEAERERLRREIETLSAQARGAVQAQIAGVAKGFDPELYAEAIAETLERRRRSEERLAALASTAEPNAGNPGGVAGQVRELVRGLPAIFADPDITPAEKNHLLSIVIERILPEGEDACRIQLRPGAGEGLPCGDIEPGAAAPDYGVEAARCTGANSTSPRSRVSFSRARNASRGMYRAPSDSVTGVVIWIHATVTGVHVEVREASPGAGESRAADNKHTRNSYDR